MARENWDKEMLRFTEMMEARAAAQPPVKLELPLDNSRELNDGLSLPLAKGGAVMAESEDRWLALRGRRILCRFHRPTAGTGHPVLVYLHGGGWVWGSVDTHDRLMREYAAASGCAVIGVDYALSPEAAFPQALERQRTVELLRPGLTDAKHSRHRPAVAFAHPPLLISALGKPSPWSSWALSWRRWACAHTRA